MAWDRWWKTVSGVDKMNYAALIKAISTTTAQLQGRAAATLNQALVIRNWMVGAWLIEFEQTGKDRAKYGTRLLETLAHDLKERGLKGLDERSLLDCRTAYRFYPQIPATLSPEFKMLDNGSAIPGSATPELAKLLKSQRFPSNQSRPARGVAIRGSLPRELPTALEPAQVLRLSWTHLQELIRIDDPWKRAFFENQCLTARWSVRQLQRQIGSLLYERTGLSANKKAVIERARKQAPQETIADLLAEGDAAPVGILLCSDKDGAEVEFATAGMDQKLFVSRYLTALPSVAKLHAFLEADRERIESLMPAARSAARLVQRKPVSNSAGKNA